MKKSTLITLFVMLLNFLNVSAQDAKSAENRNFTSFSAVQFKDKYKASYVLLDVRTAQEYKLGHVKGATSMEVMDKNMNEKIKTLNKDGNIFIYGKSAEESKLASHILAAAGFQYIYILEGGYADLLAAGMPSAK